MKKKILKTAVFIYKDEDELPGPDRQLLERARKSLDHAYAPYSNFRVGAAVRLANGKVLGGSNQENAAYPMCLCAERVAISAAESQYPGQAVTAIAITVHSLTQVIDQPAAPCGSCRQSLIETEYKHQQKIRIIMQGERGDVYVLENARQLLPLSFDGSFL